MKERIKKFYEDHKEAILIGTGATIGVLVGGAYAGRKLAKGHEITGVDLLEIPNETRKILVFKQNGLVQGFQELG